MRVAQKPVAKTMYRYDEFDQALVNERVAQFRDQVRRRLNGELTEEEFKPLRLMNGLYLQLHAYMLRVAIPYGVLSSDQLRQLAAIARRYDKGYGHFTTRQNIQFNWPALKDVPDILEELAEVEMHAIQTSGNCIRNVTSDPFAGAASDEIDDPRIFAEIIRQWSTLHPEFSFLPRKFKIAVTGAEKDRAAIKVHDIGLRLRRDASGCTGFEVIVGGGQGRTPRIGFVIREFLPISWLLTYLEAILRVYNMLGRRNNLYKARIKILVHETGREKFTELVEEEFENLLKTAPQPLPVAEVNRIRAFFAPPALPKTEPDSEELQQLSDNDAAFARWYESSVTEHRTPGYAIVTISLKPAGGVPGDATAEQMETLASLADRMSHSEIRVSHEQNLVLPHVRRNDLPEMWRVLVHARLAAPNAGLIGDIVACPGLDFCNLANARSIPVAQEISQRFNDALRQRDIGELKVRISGCINACGHHHVGHIGILGVDKKGVEHYQITLGGDDSEHASIGDIVGPAFPAASVTDAVEKIIDVYVDARTGSESFIDTYRRVGADPFRERLYGSH